MPCACNGPVAPQPKEEFEVRFKDGSTKIVDSEHAAKVAVTMAGGGTYRRR